MKNEDLEEFLKLIKDNPTLPVYAWVDNEVVAGEDYGYWLGEFGSAKIVEYVNFEMYGDSKIVEDEEEIIEYLADRDERDLPDDELIKDITEKVRALNWRKAIFVWVHTPDSLKDDTI